MKASELRMGNWIYFEKDIIKINNLNLKSIGWGNNNFAPVSLGGFKPIKLTEEWLVKFGFEKMNRTIYNSPNSKIFSLNGFFIKHYKRLDIDYYECKIGYVKLEYVHQLQNLIFALTNTELQTI